jgi:predicted proteasome-type protease
MPYIKQDLKKEKLEKIKPILKKYGLKGTMAIKYHTTLELNISAGPIDFLNNYNENLTKNFSHLQRIRLADKYLSARNDALNEKYFSGKALEAIKDLFAIIDEGNFDNSDPVTDYYNVGWYSEINFGRYEKPYILLS